MTKRFGFTLAEVLITLGIIGVVAAMTIPTLIANTNSAKFRSQFKKSLSTLNQAALMGQAQYDMNYGDATKTCIDNTVGSGKTGAEQDPDTDPTICAILNGTLSGAHTITWANEKNNKGAAYTITGSGKTGGLDATVTPADTNYIGYRLADGSVFAFNKDAKNCTAKDSANCLGFIDVNGPTLPNKEVTCDGGEVSSTAEKPCTVPNDAAHMTDVFPVIFYNSTVEPATDAARYVLTTSK